MARITKNRKVANEIREWLLAHDMWIDTRIYFDGHVYATDDPETRKEYYNDREHLIEFDDDPSRYVEYYSENGITMTFEGPLYELINYDDWSELYEEFCGLFRKHGLWFELGYAWSLATFD